VEEAGGPGLCVPVGLPPPCLCNGECQRGEYAWESRPEKYVVPIWTQIYEELLKTEEWKKREGLDFVFLLPYHLHLVEDYQNRLGDRTTLHTCIDLFCNAMHLSMQMTVENMQVRELSVHVSDNSLDCAWMFVEIWGLGGVLAPGLDWLRAKMSGWDG